MIGARARGVYEYMSIEGGIVIRARARGRAYGLSKMGIRTARELGQWGSGGKQSNIPGLYFFVKAVKLRG